MKVTVLRSNKPISEASWPSSEADHGFEAFVGRSEDCHVRIDDPLVSRHHLVLRREQAGWCVEKLAAASALTLNGERVEGLAELHVGDVLSFPPYSLRIDELPGISPRPMASAQVAAAPDVDFPLPATGVAPGIMEDTVFEDDLPLSEEQEATVFMPPPKAAAAPPEPEVDSGASDFAEASDAENGELSSAVVEDFSDLGDGPLEPLGGEMPDETVSEEEEVPMNDSEDKPMDFGDGATLNEEFGEFASADDSGQALQTMSSDDDGSTRVLQKFASYELLLFGEFAPYDRFALDQNEVFIGRDPKKCQIVLNDSEVSSVHAVLRKSMVSLTVEDLNSSNGTLLNGQRINKAELNNGDEFIVGSTTFTVQLVSDLLEAEADRLMPVELGQVVERIEEVEEEVPLDQVSTSADFNAAELEGEKSLIKRILKDPAKRKKVIIYGSVLAILLLSLMPDDPPAPPKEEEKKSATTDPAADAKPDAPAVPGKRVLSEEEIRSLEAKYKIAESYVKEKKLDEALAELEQILAVDPDYSNAKTLFTYVQEQNRKLKEEQERLKMEEARAKVREEVRALIQEAKDAVAQRNIPRAEQLFSRILEKDPENLEVTPLKMEIEEWQKEERAKKEAEARKKAERARMVDALAPGKKLYLGREWYKAILKLEEFITIKQMDEDLLKEGTEMLTDARSQLASEVAPILGRARSLKEGQDLKGAYEAYLEVLQVDPINKEGLDEVDAIREQLLSRSKRVYREAIISESLSLFSDAKEKFQEVQQISPTDSEYYRKATEKLKNYLE